MEKKSNKYGVFDLGSAIVSWVVIAWLSTSSFSFILARRPLRLLALMVVASDIDLENLIDKKSFDGWWKCRKILMLLAALCCDWSQILNLNLSVS